MVRSYWEQEMAKTSDFHKSEMLGYLISKVGRFVENAMIRNIIGQPKSGFDFRDVMDHQKILFLDLSKGVLMLKYQTVRAIWILDVCRRWKK